MAGEVDVVEVKEEEVGIRGANVSTLQNWEQARSEPNAQATVLLKLVDNDPELLKTLSSLTLAKTPIRRKPSPRGNRKVAVKKKTIAKKATVSRKKKAKQRDSAAA